MQCCAPFGAASTSDDSVKAILDLLPIVVGSVIPGGVGQTDPLQCEPSDDPSRLYMLSMIRAQKYDVSVAVAVYVKKR